MKRATLEVLGVQALMSAAFFTVTVIVIVSLHKLSFVAKWWYDYSLRYGEHSYLVFMIPYVAVVAIGWGWFVGKKIMK